MKLIFLTVVLVVLASCIESKSLPIAIEQRDMADFIANQLGLGAIWTQINSLGNNFASEIIGEGIQLIIAGGKEKLAAAQAIFAKLVDDLTNHGIQSLQAATMMVQMAIKEVATLLKGSEKRGILDFALTTLGLEDVWAEVQALGGNFAAQLLAESMQLIFAGKEVLAQAKEIFKQMAANLLNHTGNAATIVADAIAMVAELLKKPTEKRQIADFLLNQLGLQGVWDEIQSLGDGFAAQLIAEGMQLIFSGKEVLAQAQVIFAQLVSDLTAHTANASTLVQTAITMVAELLKKPSEKRQLANFLLETIGLQGVWDEIQSLGDGFAAQLIAEGMQLVFSGKEVLAQAQVIFAQLVSDLTAHTANASTLVQTAITMVAELLKKPTAKRNIGDFIVNTLGLGAVWEQINALGGGFVSQIISEGTQLIFAGQEKLEAAKQVFATLVDELMNHGIQTAQTATTMVKEAIKEVSNILSGNSQKRDLADFIVNQLGLGAVWDQIQALGNASVSQIIEEGLALLVSGKEVFAQAKEIFLQLAKDLAAHTSNASTLVAAAVAQVAELLKQPKQF